MSRNPRLTPGGSAPSTSSRRTEHSVTGGRECRRIPEGFHVSFGSTPYAYHDGYYEGIEHEFRGFGAATEEATGDANHPTSFTRTFFHQGRRASEIASDRLAYNPDEPLKAEPHRTESWDTLGRSLSTSHRTLTVRQLHPGLDGRMVRTAFESQSDQLLYDVSPFTYLGTALSLPHVVRPTGTENRSVLILGNRYGHTRTTADNVDNLGQPVQTTAWGRLHAEWPGDSPDDETVASHATYVNVSGSATGWLWRPSLTWIDGHGNPTDLGSTTHSYNSRGDETSTVIDVNQTTTYSFAPTLGSPSPEDISATKTVDNWGNATVSCVGGDAASGTG
ncbi:MAG: toxin TcdB middle/N-terminal domain-containing protein, partial [Gemmatimonadales bacterium]